MNMDRASLLAFVLAGFLLIDAAHAVPADPPTASSPTTPPPPSTALPASVPPVPIPSPVAPPVTTADGHTVVPAVVEDKTQGQPAPQKHEAPEVVVAQDTNASPKEQAAAIAQSANPAAPSGFRLMTLSTNALLSRVSLADQAKQTIDLQYYVFNNDATGRLIALHLLQAADRGVHVRMLIDDLNIADDARMFKALDEHPNIEVKLFNPFHSATASGLSKLAQFVLEFRRLNRRMHNKDFIVDNQVAIIGGRNIGDSYFDASADNNFRDLDLIAIGPVVPAATAAFEAYWNSDASRPMAEFRGKAKAESAATDAAVAAEVAKVEDSKADATGATKPDATKRDSIKPETRMPHPTSTEVASSHSPAALSPAAIASMSSENPAIERAFLEKNARTFESSAYKAAAADDLPNGASADRPGNWYWGPASLVADRPEKIDAGPERIDLRINPQLNGMIRQAQSEVLVISPYFVPSAKGEADFVAVAKRGVAFKVLTNSLASTDELPVYSAYSEHRRKLLAGGVQLYELKPAPGVAMTATDEGLSSGLSLHAKSIVVDHRYVFIGSMNMDQRSNLLNTEMGVVVDSTQLAKAVAEFFATATLPANAYHVVLGSPDGKDSANLHWEYNAKGKDVDASAEPDASLGRHAKAMLMKLLPIDGLL